jgi:DNA-binding TFAR19-related protein (PDSD5 family)
VPLEKELAGKNTAQRQSILVEACKDEARQRVFRKSLTHQILDYSARTRLNDLCNSMQKRMADKAVGDRAELAQSCRKEANFDRVKDPRRIARMSAVCDGIIKEMRN